MRTIFTVFLMLSLFAIEGLSQRLALRTAQAHIDNERFSAAIRELQPLLSSDEVNGEAYLLSGIAYLNEPGGAQKALELLDVAIESFENSEKTSRRALEAMFYKGQALHLNYRFEEAVSLHRQLLEKLNDSEDELRDAIAREIAYGENAISMVQHPVSIEIQSMGEAVNTVYTEHSPVVSLDESTVYFTSNRPISKIEDVVDEDFEAIYVTYWREGKWTDAIELDLPGNYYGNRATIGISADGNSLIFYQNDGVVGNLYQTRMVFGKWTEPEPFPEPINSAYNETHASMSLDGKRIYFSSDRPGGYGGKDLYVSFLLPNGLWGEPLNLGPNINTDQNEASPFLHVDGRTLYFSSDSESSMGGYDIFSAELDEDGNWGNVSNLGYPINTPDDDIFFMPTPDGLRVYYASRKSGGFGSTDLYMITLPSDDDRSLAVVASHIFNENKEPLGDAVIRIYNVETDMLEGVYRPNSLSGKFVAVLPTGTYYRMEIEADGFEGYEQNFDLKLGREYEARHRAHYLDYIILRSVKESNTDL